MADGRKLICGQLMERVIGLKEGNCEGNNECHRSYMFYLPNVVCDSNIHSSSIVVIPLVYAVHCFGCTAQTMIHYQHEAEQYGFALAIPQGIAQSFNAKVCCGTAMEQQIDDAGFFRQILTHLYQNQLFGHFISRHAIYGIGWSNGAYMVTYVASMFRAIAPISGYQYHNHNLNHDIHNDIHNDTLLPIPVPVPVPIPINHPIGLFLHHSLNDKLVQFSGCCNDPTMPQCCCHISQRSPPTCHSAPHFVQQWATVVNQCGTKNRNHNNNNNNNYAKATTIINKQQKTPIIPEISFVDTVRNITCKTYTTKSCSTTDSAETTTTATTTATTTTTEAAGTKNTTICVHQHGGHFNIPDHATAFPMRSEVMEFFARDACSITNPKNRWDTTTKTCICDSSSSMSSPLIGGSYCLEAPPSMVMMLMGATPTAKIRVTLMLRQYWMGVVVVLLTIIIYLGYRRNRPRHTKYKTVRFPNNSSSLEMT